MKIRPSDIIKGSTYLKLVNDYKAYDARQKDVIEDLRKKVVFLEWQVEDLRIELNDSWAMDELGRLLEERPSTFDAVARQKLLKKIENQRITLNAYRDRMLKLRAQIQRLKIQNNELISENMALKRDSLTKD